MSLTDAGFYFAEGENTPMHVGSVAVFDGPAPSYGDVIRLLLSKLPRVPRYRQRVRTLPLHLGRPLWMDDEHFQILYHVRHTAVPRPGGAEQLRNLAGRVLGQRLDMTKPLWEVYLVEGLENDRWALISKVHHCMVDGVAGTDLMQLIFDVEPDAVVPEPGEWSPEEAPSTASVVAGSLQDAVSFTMRQLGAVPPALRRISETPREILRRGATIGTALPGIAQKITTPRARSLNGPIGPHRRWVWAETSFDAIKGIRTSLGGTVNDVVLTAITRGFRDLLAKRGELTDRLVVRSMVPVSVRRPGERGTLNNQVSAVFVDLPVAEPDPVQRLHSLRRQMDENKRINGAVDARSIIAMGDFVAPTLMAMGTRAGIRAGQSLAQTVTTNVPGPPIPLYVLGRRLTSLYAYVPIAAGFRISIGIFSYQRAMTMGINADFDAFPDIDVLADGIRAGVDELVAAAGDRAATATATMARMPAPATAPKAAKPSRAPAKKVAKKATKRTPAPPKSPAS
jgi:WS/DGAT/MGAT family acyltransferase